MGIVHKSASISWASEYWSLTTTSMDLLDRKDLIVATPFPEMKSLCHTMPKVFEISNEITLVMSILSRALLVLCVITDYQQWT